MQRFSQFLAGIALASLAMPGMAQTSQWTDRDNLRGASVRTGIVIPFGSSGSKAERAPRLELASVRVGRATSGYRLRDDREPVKAEMIRLGIAIDGKPKMIVNGQEMAQQGDQNNIGTLGWVGIGAGVLVVTFGLAVFGAFGQCLTPC